MAGKTNSRSSPDFAFPTPHSPFPTSTWLKRFRRSVRRWYDRHGRNLPWRETCDPYRIWISEIMLQQTTVAAVVPYFERFLERFPTVEVLADASQGEVLRCWEGLGYYSRARNIHRTARRVIDEHEGRFPDEARLLQRLPGIGRYTAGAIASFAFNRRAPILEANTLRLYSRLLGYRGDPKSSAGQQVLWDFAECILPRKCPGRFNQALMELGSRVCTPNAPDCSLCPVRSCCQAFAEGVVDKIPRLPVRQELTAVTEAAVAVRKNGRYLLRRRGEGERWSGLWDFPRFPLPERLVSKQRTDGGEEASRLPALKRELESSVSELTGITADVGELLMELKHGVTRYRIRLLCFRAEHREGATHRKNGLRWVRPAEFGAYPLSVTGRKLANLLGNSHQRPTEPA